MKTGDYGRKFRNVAGILLIISAITHILQLFFVGFEWHDISAAVIGFLYGILGILLIYYKDNKVLAIIGILFPAFGGTLGLFRLITIEILLNGSINWFIIWHLIADLIIIPCCILSYINIKRNI